MQRLPEERRLSRRLDATTVESDLHHVAHLVAAFHQRGRARGPTWTAASGHAAVVDLWEAGIEQLDSFADDIINRETADRVALLAHEYLAGRSVLLDERVARGRACDGQGNLQAEDIFVLDNSRAGLDCLSVRRPAGTATCSPTFAFLTMDLERLGHPELRRFLDQGTESSQPTRGRRRWPTCTSRTGRTYTPRLPASDMGRVTRGRGPGVLHLALGHLESAGERVLVGGSPGTGKSTLARELADHVGAVIVSSDEVRDEIQPCDGTSEHVLDGDIARSSSPRSTTRCCGGPRSSWITGKTWCSTPRGSIRPAGPRPTTARGDSSCHLTELRCACPVEVATERIERGVAHGNDMSEATPGLARRLAEGAAALGGGGRGPDERLALRRRRSRRGGGHPAVTARAGHAGAAGACARRRPRGRRALRPPRPALPARHGGA